MAQSKKRKAELISMYGSNRTEFDPYNPNEKRSSFAEFVKENQRWRSLTREQKWAEYDAACGERDRLQEEERKKREEERKIRNEESARQAYINNRNPNSLNDGETVVLWLAVMAVGTIFKARLFIWIFAIIMLWLHFTRETRRAVKWDNGGKEEYYKKIEEVCKNGGKK